MLFNSKRESAIEAGARVGWLSSMGGGSTRSAAGQIVTPQSAMALPVLQACVSTIAESVAQLPLEVFERQDDGGRKPATAHPAYDLLKYAPNEWQTPFEAREYAQTGLGLRGNAYSYIERDGRGRPTALIPLNPGDVQVFKGQNLQPFYSIEGATPIPARFIHHVRWVSLDKYTGLSPIALHANSIGYAQALEEYGGKSFQHGTALSGVLERPKEAPAIKDQKMLDDLSNSWQAKFGGSSNPGRVAVLQEGTTFKALSMSNVDAELIGTLKLASADIARIYKVPPPMLGFMEAATYNNVESMQTNFVIYCLLPWLKRHEQAMQRDLLLLSERKSLTIEFNVAGLMRGNQQARYAAYAVARQWGWLSVNDIRRLENLEKVSGGEIYLRPLNMVDANDPQAVQKNTPSSSADPKEGAAASIDEITKVLA